MLRFVQESLYPSKIPPIQLNFYKAMEQMLEENRDRFTDMTCMQFVAEGVERRLDEEGKKRVREAIAKRMKCEPPAPPVRLDLHATMIKDIRGLQQIMSDTGTYAVAIKYPNAA